MKGRVGVSSRLNRKKDGGSFKLAMLMALCGLLAWGVYLAGRSSVFALREVVFYGNKQLSLEELLRLTGPVEGRNMFSLSPEEISDKLLASPWITEVRVRKEFHCERLLVRVEEASPLALLRDKKGLFLVDRRGDVLEKLSGSPVSFLPVIVDVSGERGAAFRETLALAWAVKETGLASEASCVEIRDFEKGIEEITLTMDGLKAKVGGGRHREKLSRLLELTGEIKRRAIKVDYVDLRFAQRVVVKPIKAVAGSKGVKVVRDGG